MWSKDEWLKRAGELDIGRKRRIDDDCGSGRTLLVSRGDKGYTAHCFRCGENDWAPNPHESTEQKLARYLKASSSDTEVRRSVDLPGGSILDVSQWPIEAYLWLVKAGLSRWDIGRLGARYHPGTNRVMLPVIGRSTQNLEFWQARSIDGRQPKYIAPAIDKSRVVPQWGHAKDVTLVEDILSSYKVGLIGEGWSMLGTKLSDYVLSELMRRARVDPEMVVNVWLDNDLPPLHPVNRGQIAATKVMAQLRAIGLTARNIVSPRDPKLMTRAEIKESLQGEQPLVSTSLPSNS